jgi:hypothetical protein
MAGTKGEGGFVCLAERNDADFLFCLTRKASVPGNMVFVNIWLFLTNNDNQNQDSTQFKAWCVFKNCGFSILFVLVNFWAVCFPCCKDRM